MNQEGRDRKRPTDENVRKHNGGRKRRGKSLREEEGSKVKRKRDGESSGS